jgi:hypothetical protein
MDGDIPSHHLESHQDIGGVRGGVSPRISAVHRRAIFSDLMCGDNTSGDHP